MREEDARKAVERASLGDKVYARQRDNSWQMDCESIYSRKARELQALRAKALAEATRAGGTTPALNEYVE